MKKEIIKSISSLNAKRCTLNASPGFTVLFAVLIGSILFSIGIAIAHLSTKEILLSVAGKQSEIAFFAADTGIECALYYDLRVGDIFPESSAGSVGGPIVCSGNNNVTVTLDDSDSTAATSTFQIDFSPSGCAEVFVGKTVTGSTVIESRGRNDCGGGVNRARVERALRVRY